MERAAMAVDNSTDEWTIGDAIRYLVDDGVPADVASSKITYGLRFVGKLGIEKGTGDYKDKNVLAEVITPDRKEWHAVEQVPAAKPSPASPATPIAKPAWAK
jgi:hypothetical protein